MNDSGDDKAAVLAILGGDDRVLRLFELALLAYKYLPDGMMSLTTGKTTRTLIIEIIESFGFRAAPIPWERFPKRFHRNKPILELFKAELTDAEIEQYFVDLIAAQSVGRLKCQREKLHV